MQPQKENQFLIIKMVLTKKKIGKVFKKVLVGTEQGYRRASKFAKKHGPGFNRGMGRVAASIQESFCVDTTGKHCYPEGRKDMYLKIDERGRGKFVRTRPSRRVDWDTLGMRF